MTSLAAAAPEELDVEMITDAKRLAVLVDTLRDEPLYAVDTEFHREKSYFPRVALVQIAWPTGIALVDPLAVDLHPFGEILDGPGCAVLHAAQQDLEVMARSCGTVPRELFDTQIAAGFLGHATPSLVNLVQGELGIRLPKGDRLTDWLRRPLTKDQCTYAASDVAHLLELHRRFVEQLNAVGRLSWVQAECEGLRRFSETIRRLQGLDRGKRDPVGQGQTGSG